MHIRKASTLKGKVGIGLLVSAVGIALCLPRSATAQSTARYTYTIIDVPGAAHTYASGINNAGQIVGYYLGTAGGIEGYHGFLYSDGKFTTIDPPNAQSTYGTYAYGINDAGAIVGVYAKSGGIYGFLDSGGKFTSLNASEGSYDFTYSRGINNIGQIVGDINLGSGFLDSGGDFSFFTDPSGNGFTTASGINDAGQIVGYSLPSGFLYSEGSFTTIALPGAFETIASGINNTGQIVGYSLSNGTGYSHVFLYTSGKFTIVDTTPLDANGVFAAGINDAGQIVGAATYNGGIEHAFLATPGAARPEILFNGYDSADELQHDLNVTFDPPAAGQDVHQAVAEENIQQALVGQKITLTGALPAADTVQSQEWRIDGNPIGGYTPTKDSFQTGQTLPLVKSNAAITFYWAAPTTADSGPYTVEYDYTLTNGQSGNKIIAKYNVLGPTEPHVKVSRGQQTIFTCTTIDYDNKLCNHVGAIYSSFGDPDSTPGITFSGSASVPSTITGHFWWVQIIQKSAEGWGNSPHSAGCAYAIGLDTVYPYNDVPSEDYSTVNDTPKQLVYIPGDYLINNTYSVNASNSATDEFSAIMYFMWLPGIEEAIPAPLGTIVWGYSAAATKTSNAWLINTARSYSHEDGFSASTAYPEWNSLDNGATGRTCVTK